MKNLLSTSLTIFMLFIFSSCGVMFGGSKYSASIVAKDHPEAKIYVNGKKIGQGTAIGLYPRNKSLVVEVQQEGCENKKQTFDNTFRTGNFVLSLACWGLIGALIDVGTGASFKPDHKGDSSIEKLSDKNYIFTVDYSECNSTPLTTASN